MRKYLDLVGYPIMLGSVYVLLGFVNWDKDPATWEISHRTIWIAWGLAWGWALSIRIKEH